MDPVRHPTRQVRKRGTRRGRKGREDRNRGTFHVVLQYRRSESHGKQNDSVRPSRVGT